MNKYLLSFLVFLGIVKVGSLFAQTPANDPHWQLNWEENFNTLDTMGWLNTTINPNAKWRAKNYSGTGSVPIVFLSDNVNVSNGKLILSLKRDDFYCPQWVVNPFFCGRQMTTGLSYSYTAGYIETSSNNNFQFGYIESRIKVPYAKGIFPAYWTLLAENVSNPSNVAEIDIFEMIATDLDGHTASPSVLHTNLHYSFPDNVLGGVHAEPIKLYDFNYSDWHTYGLEWSPTTLTFYIDGQVTRKSVNHGIVDPVRIIYNHGVYSGEFPSDSSLPLDMSVDYLRVYKLKNDCNTDLVMCNYNFVLHDNKVKKTITIGDGTCSNSLIAGDNVYLRASDGITINGNFDVPIGAELFLNSYPCFQ